MWSRAYLPLDRLNSMVIWSWINSVSFMEYCIGSRGKYSVSYSPNSLLGGFFYFFFFFLTKCSLFGAFFQGNSDPLMESSGSAQWPGPTCIGPGLAFFWGLFAILDVEFKCSGPGPIFPWRPGLVQYLTQKSVDSLQMGCTWAWLVQIWS